MRILIAGATGLIGKELVAQLLEKDRVVHYLTTRKSELKSTDNYKGFYWNPKRGIIDTKAFEDVGVIINLAGANVSRRWTRSHKRSIIRSRTEPAQLLFESLKKGKYPIRHYISASGISVYPSSFDHLYHEHYEGCSASFLGQVVKTWEETADMFTELGIKVAKIRTGIVLDETDGALPTIMKPIKMGVGALLGTGEQWQSWIHIQDIAGIYMHVMNHGLEGIYNAVSPNPVTNKKMTIIIANLLDKSLWVPPIPAFILRIILGEMADIALESQLVSAEKIQENGYQFKYVNLENALDNLLGKA